MGIVQRLYDRRVRNVYREVAGSHFRVLMPQKPKPVEVWMTHCRIMLGVHKKLGTKGTHHETPVNDAAFVELAHQLRMTTEQLDRWLGVPEGTGSGTVR